MVCLIAQSIGQYFWTPLHRTYKCPLHSYGRDPGTDGPAHFSFLRRTSEMLGTPPPAGSVHLPAIHWFLSEETADKHSRTSSGSKPYHWQEGEINEHPRGNQVWSCLFPKTCKNLGASWLWMLDKASTWSAYSRKQSCPAEHTFTVIYLQVLCGPEHKVSLPKIPESERNV